ncbi:hypothetical protein A3C91_01815 [Candidatus Azambacteria bacterium RIFCSPHIGHO2_02_FULL_52_12]|uniref:Uncharacterized protein n=1 Tax=Candidatus Azambacteria bacterium RIFCSPLOWO2_01_FULL_46_25 TaxID=1797298 RepID=A0A1F5BVE5_9BACT|nr:MAG: hypothetical protein A3C91_01815 [Candidatus Azambacteria bacterium RIFCSPHIGHO2_02_FULL_52_12]OGD34577.1 MAG: hypothetical protein A2988_03675 [Candidatus Azambacteria bacterium RIFCSPLOWO2_01_FULL_46_25]OGD37983.1 MAG: hypothetical protein A2850_00625 [Candidatus Azambacteria bacterium RIFCSPHIGHO2_01_FULL_51_74]
MTHVAGQVAEQVQEVLMPLWKIFAITVPIGLALAITLVLLILKVIIPLHAGEARVVRYGDGLFHLKWVWRDATTLCHHCRKPMYCFQQQKEKEHNVVKNFLCIATDCEASGRGVVLMETYLDSDPHAQIVPAMVRRKT